MKEGIITQQIQKEERTDKLGTRLKQIAIVVYENLFSKFLSDVVTIDYTCTT